MGRSSRCRHQAWSRNPCVLAQELSRDVKHDGYAADCDHITAACQLSSPSSSGSSASGLSWTPSSSLSASSTSTGLACLFRLLERFQVLLRLGTSGLVCRCKLSRLPNFEATFCHLGVHRNQFEIDLDLVAASTISASNFAPIISAIVMAPA